MPLSDAMLLALSLEQLRSLQKAYETSNLSEAAGICNNLGIRYAEIGKISFPHTGRYSVREDRNLFNIEGNTVVCKGHYELMACLVGDVGHVYRERVWEITPPTEPYIHIELFHVTS